MSDTNQPTSGSNSRRRQVRLAYTLNNHQPVRCTLVSEDPLFYLDAPLSEDEEFLDLELLTDILNEDEQAVASVTPHHAEEAIDLFKVQFGKTQTTGTIALSETINTLKKSRMGEALLAFAIDHGTQVVEHMQTQAVSYDRVQNIISVRPGLTASEQILLLARECRRVWQHRQGALLHPLMFHPDHAIIVNRIQAADLMVAMIRAAWELRLAGVEGPWAYLSQNGYDDLTRSFAREAGMDFRALNNGRAAAAVFESWFLSERCRMFDRTLIQQMLADYQGYMHSAGHAETSHVLTHQLIAALGEMPFGTNYLAPYVATIMADPIFTEIRDRSNANFLWFIKFEQSFRQTERELGGETLGAAPVQKSATILSYPQFGKESLGTRQGQVSPGTGTVVELKHWKK